MPAGAAFGEPVTSLRVEIRTSSARSAGTDDDVYLRVGGGLRFALDKRLYDDFERGDRDTYSVPIDDAVRAGLTIGDLYRVQIEKSRDGVAGGWKLRGVKLIANGRQIYARDGIERWLEDHLVERGFGGFALVPSGSGHACDAARARARIDRGELRISVPKIAERRGAALDIPLAITSCRILFIGDIVGRPGRELRTARTRRHRRTSRDRFR